MTALLEASGLTLAGRLRPSSLCAEAGDLVCLVGPNGSGKTSLLHAIAGIGDPGGRVRIGDADPRRSGPDERKRLLSYLPASRDVAWPLAARDLIALGLPADADKSSIGRIVEELELAALAGRRVDRLSTGERSRVLIARALAPRPRLLLLDEPVANLDPLWQLRLMDLLATLTREQGQAVILALHDLDLAARYADRLIVMDKGRIAAEGLDRGHVAAIFGIERIGGEWRPALSRAEDRRSSP